LDPGGIAAENRALNPLIPNHMEHRDRNCICPTSWPDGEQTGPIRAMCEVDLGVPERRQPDGGRRLMIIFGRETGSVAVQYLVRQARERTKACTTRATWRRGEMNDAALSITL
jgi:hypothetical protein